MRDEELCLWSDADLREYILTGTTEDWAEIKRRFTREQLEDLKRVLYPPPVPSAAQTELLLSKISASNDEAWLQSLVGWLKGWSGLSDFAGRDRIDRIRTAVERKLVELVPPAPQAPRRAYFTFPPPQWVSPPVDRAQPVTRPPSSAASPRPASGGDAGPWWDGTVSAG